ncbi:MAG: glycosyltransferase [Bacteroidales bacterium]|nr:glycosyltransferase [Bacteroidales bacterium]
MKILQICNKPPFPPQDGGSIGMHNVTQGLIDAGHQVKVLSVNTPKHFVDINNLPKEYRETTQIEFGFINTDIKALEALSNLALSNRSYNISRFEDKSFENLIVKVLRNQKFDIIQLESVFLNYYIDSIRKNSDAKIILRAPNVEFMIWERMAQEEKKTLKKRYFKVLAKRLKKEELEAIRRFDAIYTVTQNDLNIFKSHACKIPMEFIPTGVDVTKNINIDKVESEYPSLFHIGALDWMPNKEGILWFLDKVWKKVSENNPNIKFYIAGRGDASWLDVKLYKNVVLLGEIDNAANFIKSKAIMIVPLFSGSGMRVKIIEGMTLGKAIVSTSVGVEGIIHNHKQDLLVADSPKEFIDALELLLKNKPYFENICKSAKETVEKNYANSALTDKLIRFLESL